MKAVWEKSYQMAVKLGLLDSIENKASYHRAWCKTGKILGRKEPRDCPDEEPDEYAWLNE